MEAFFKQDGNCINYTAGDAGVNAGDIIIAGDLIGVAKHDIAPNTVGAIALGGCYNVIKDAVAFTLGAKVYFNTTTRKAVATASGNTLIGVCVAAAATTDGIVEVKIG